MSHINFEGQLFEPAWIEGRTDVFKNSNFSIVKRSWQPDNEAQFCPICASKFGWLKRKHHCRQCGMVVCHKCCHEKVPLSQLGLEESDKVCDPCLPITRLVTRSRSSDQHVLQDVAQELAQLCRDIKNIPKIFTIGGYHTLLALGSKHDVKIMEHVVAGLHTLSIYQPLHEYMVSTGHIAVLCEILRQKDIWTDQILLDGISTLMIFCKTTKYIERIVETGFLHMALELCQHDSETVALLAVSLLSQLLTLPGSHEPIMDRNKQSLSRLLALTASDNEQMQAVALKCLNYLSLDSDTNKHKIVQEDFISGKPLVMAFQRTTENSQVLANAVCLVANLATSQDDQKCLEDYRNCLIDIFSAGITNLDVLVHSSRGIANFSKFRQNYDKMISVLPLLVRMAVCHNNTSVKVHGLRATMSLLMTDPEHTSQELLREGAAQVFKHMAGNKDVMSAIAQVLLQQQSELAVIPRNIVFILDSHNYDD